MEVFVGCCSLPLPLDKYAKEFPTVEIDRIFYAIPRVDTVKRWRNIASNLIFNVKAYQGLTHPLSSPTYRRVKKPEGNADNFGHLKPTEENFMLWQKMLEIIDALDAYICLFQLPPSFIANEENMNNAKRFFANIDKHSLLAIEFRHSSWTREKISLLIDEFGLIHAVDPFKDRAVSKDINYYRLHGLGSKPYRYKYTDSDLLKLKEVVSSNHKSFVMFNNIYMLDDARRFMALYFNR
ncbi:MAG: hypothetical protein KatS3mg003_1005 [Candidatus Nitrosocaldaceae archaeon]|nr:MAG: hypothetical protein KatS3mg003_1005 [Candidatus Nitrosocaldaceae archaeon]